MTPFTVVITSLLVRDKPMGSPASVKQREMAIVLVAFLVSTRGFRIIIANEKKSIPPVTEYLYKLFNLKKLYGPLLVPSHIRQ